MGTHYALHSGAILARVQYQREQPCLLLDRVSHHLHHHNHSYEAHLIPSPSSPNTFLDSNELSLRIVVRAVEIRASI